MWLAEAGVLTPKLLQTKEDNMLPIKTILCSTDFSSSSFRGLEAAVELARHFDSKLIVTHVVHSMPSMASASALSLAEMAGSFNISKFQSQVEQQAREEVTNAVMERTDPKMDVEIVIRSGNAADQILETAHEKDADLIVIATHGRTGVKRMALGSVAERVVRHSDRPVMTVRLEQ